MSAPDWPDQCDWPEGVDLLHLPEVVSTMEEAARRAAQLPRPTWILADRQSGGRGRMGRPWSDGVGNFMATLSLPLEEPPARAALRSFIAANALYDALVGFVPARDLAIKWPNDLLLRGGKLAGILLESSGAGRLFIGIGVNLVQAPKLPEAPFPPVTLGAEVSPRPLLTHLAAAFARHEAEFRANGFDKTRKTWLMRAARLGETIKTRTGRTEFIGTFDSIDEDGSLVLITGAGPQIIPAGEVFF